MPGFFKARGLISSDPFVSSFSSSELNSEGSDAGEQDMFTTISPDSPISSSVVEEISLPHAFGPTTSLSVTLISGMVCY